MRQICRLKTVSSQHPGPKLGFILKNPKLRVCTFRQIRGKIRESRFKCQRAFYLKTIIRQDSLHPYSHMSLHSIVFLHLLSYRY